MVNILKIRILLFYLHVPHLTPKLQNMNAFLLIWRHSIFLWGR